MSSEKPWRAQTVLFFCAAQFIFFAAGASLEVFLHHFRGFQRAGDFGNIVLGTLSFQGATWILIPFILRKNEARFSDIFGFKKTTALHSLVLALGVLLVTIPCVLVLEAFCVKVLEQIGWPLDQQAAIKLFFGAKLWPTGIYLGIFAVVIAPVAEEFIFRGVLFPFVKQLGFPKLAWIGVSLLFAAIHLDVAIFLPLFVLALVLTWLYEKTGGLTAPIIAHSLFNAVNLFMLFVHERV